MTTEERVLRLENAFATLSELAANARSDADREKARADAILQLVRQHDENMKAEASRTDTLLQLVRDVDSRSETQMTWINSLGSRMEELAAAQANVDTKIGALADAQIRTEESLARTNEALASLTTRVDALSETVERYISERRNGES